MKNIHEYHPVEDTSFNFQQYVLEVGPSGLPMDRSIMSWPALLYSIFNSEVTLKTYCGSLDILLKLCIKKCFKMLNKDIFASYTQKSVTFNGIEYFESISIDNRRSISLGCGK